MGIVDPHSILITLELNNQIAEIERFKGKWQFLEHLHPQKLQTLKTIATIESIGSSTRIEGSKLSDSQVQLLLSGIDPLSFQDRDEQEVAGYAFVCEKIFDLYPQIPFTENTIKQLHYWLLQYCDRDISHRGEYKKIPINIEAFNSNRESIGVIYKTSSPFETPFKMADLVEWTTHELDQKKIHPLIVIGIFVVLFLGIHPFQDGNGRLSRLLTTFLMLKCGYKYVPYSSLESIIEVNKEAYYKALRLTQTGWQENRPDWTPWLNFFFSALLKQIRHLEIKLDEINQISQKPHPLHQKIVSFLQSHGPLSISEIVALTKENRNTLKKALKELVDSGVILLTGKGKNCRYRMFVPDLR